MKIAKLPAIVVFAASLACAAPLHAQQGVAPLHEQVIDGLRGLFGRIFGGAGQAQQPAPESQRAPAPAMVPVPEPAASPPSSRASLQPPEPVVTSTPVAQAAARSLHDAISRGDYAAALQMIEQGADVEAKDPGAGASALHFAVMKGRMPIIDLLLSRGANANSRTRNGTTPLHTAVLYSRTEVAELLLDNGAEIDAASTSGATPLALALAANNQTLAGMLRTRGAKDTAAAKRLLRH